MTLSAAAAGDEGLREVRDGTRPFREIEQATAAGYGLLTGTPLEACIDEPGEGGMGFHYINGDLVGDVGIDIGRPEALLYVPTAKGDLELVGVEYVVFAAEWDAANDAAPSLLGNEFHLVSEPNRYELPAFYELHIWAWKDDPSGTFYDWNPTIDCSPPEMPDTSTSTGSGVGSALPLSLLWTGMLLLASLFSISLAKKRGAARR